MDAVNKLAHRLRELRGDRSLYEVGEASGIQRKQIQRYELGRIPEDSLLHKLAKFYGVSFKELKLLVFDDLYPDGSEEQALILEWAKIKSL